MTLISAFCGLFGCGKAPVYTIEDIRSVSVSCGHMDYSHSYSFYLRKTESGWLLDADYATDTVQQRTAFETCAVADEEAKELLAVVQATDVIGKLRRYKKPKLKVQAADETTYYTSILFADGEQLSAATHTGDDLMNAFIRLAGKHALAAEESDEVKT